MRYRGLCALLYLLLVCFTATAVTPQFWENFTQEELLKGTLTRVSLTSDGKLFLAPSYEMVYDTGQPYIFSMVRDKAGNLYLGTGHEGKVFKVDSKGNGTLYYQSKELDIFALALDGSDTLYVGSSPDGKVYKVTGPNQATEFCAPEEKYIWSLVFDDAGNLYVGTGGRGIIHKVDRAGKKSTFYDSDDSHIVSLVREGANLLAGTSPGGLVLQINPQGKAFTLLDSPMEEIRSLALDRFGTVHAVASSSKGLASPPPVKSSPSPDATAGALPIVTIQAIGSLSEKPKEPLSAVTAPGGEKDSTGSKSSIYSITKDGSTETVFTSREQMVYDVMVRADGSILASTGGKGRLLSIDGAKQVTVITDSPEEQMTRLVQGTDAVWVAGSNQGKVYRLQSQRTETGTFESKLLDAKTVAAWGKIAWNTMNPAGGKARQFLERLERALQQCRPAGHQPKGTVLPMESHLQARHQPEHQSSFGPARESSDIVFTTEPAPAGCEHQRSSLRSGLAKKPVAAIRECHLFVVDGHRRGSFECPARTRKGKTAFTAAPDRPAGRSVILVESHGRQ
jgi:hypothetical protein